MSFTKTHRIATKTALSLFILSCVGCASVDKPTAAADGQPVTREDVIEKPKPSPVRTGRVEIAAMENAHAEEVPAEVRETLSTLDPVELNRRMVRTEQRLVAAGLDPTDEEVAEALAAQIRAEEEASPAKRSARRSAGPSKIASDAPQDAEKPKRSAAMTAARTTYKVGRKAVGLVRGNLPLAMGVL